MVEATERNNREQQKIFLAINLGFDSFQPKIGEMTSSANCSNAFKLERFSMIVELISINILPVKTQFQLL